LHEVPGFNLAQRGGAQDASCSGRFRSADRASEAWLADGTIDATYHAPDRAVAIYNAKDLDAMNALIDKIPLGHFMEREIEPLTDLFEQMQGALDYLRKREAKG
jgi:muconolactone delta-isomerase